MMLNQMAHSISYGKSPMKVDREPSKVRFVGADEVQEYECMLCG